MKPSESELISAAEQYVFEKNGDRFSNNNDEAGNNFASFLAGANWAIDRHYQLNDWKSAAMKLGENLSKHGPDGYYDFTADQWFNWAVSLKFSQEQVDDTILKENILPKLENK